MTTRSPTETIFSVKRLTIPVPGADEFQGIYEDAVPEVPLDDVVTLVSRRAPWSEMVELVESTAPHGFLRYAKTDVHLLMRAAGDDAYCVSYLMGNHVVAERMFRHDPRAMLYAPLRTVIWEDPAGGGWLTVDQPSTQFGSLGISEVSEVGVELDRKLGALLRALDLEVPRTLLES